MGITLVYRSGSLSGRRGEFDQELIRLGRKADNDVSLSDTVVSSYHAEIRRKGSQYVLVDLESTNGTFVNGERVDGKTKLRNRDKIEIGENGPVLEFRTAEAAEAGDHPQLVLVSGSWELEGKNLALSPGIRSVGRGLKNDIVVGREQGSIVSTKHAEIRFDGKSCEIEDCGSTNGTYLNGSQVRAARLSDRDRIELGTGGPVLELRWKSQGARRSSAHEDSEHVFRKLERASKGGPAGERTMMLLHAANRYYKRRRWPLIVLSVVVLLVALAAGGLYYRERQENQRLRRLAADVFYSIRSLDAELMKMRQREGFSSSIQSGLERKKRLNEEYNRYLESLGLYQGKSATEVEVMQMARELGETDLDVPRDFYRLAMAYVEKWRNDAGMRRALENAQKTKILDKIRVALNQRGLPRQFLFIALQESRYDPGAVGPPTNFGFAKGMWQFIPGTAAEYGLKVGPLKDQRVFDPQDERHNDIKATEAAARYLADLYASKAQASGLLVIASYNYGATRIIKKLDGLSNDPRDRNFWNFYRNQWLPDETRDYVMSIFSAAMICDKPHLFNFSMQPID
jgi:membrane-bound lytic murein transglycosylase D